jgi:murein L,D-transpeptidase YafK
MGTITVGQRWSRRLGIMAVAALSCALVAACSGGSGDIVPAGMRPIPKEAQQLLAKKGMSAWSPMLVRIYKEESELEVWKQRDDGRFHHFKTYPICNWSGELGPKLKQGDKQAPEGFYTVSAGQMNPNSQFYLAFNLGFPNTFDKSHGRTGANLMVHGDCRSSGCYAMTDALVEEIYAIARESLVGGNQQFFQVHAFPFRMTDENMKRHAKHKWMPFWRSLKDGYDDFEASRKPLNIAVCEKRYLVNVDFSGHAAPSNPASACPPYQRVKPDLFVEAAQSKIADARITAPGKKTRDLVAEAEARANGSSVGTLSLASSPDSVSNPPKARGFFGWALGMKPSSSKPSLGFAP